MQCYSLLKHTVFSFVYKYSIKSIIASSETSGPATLSSCIVPRPSSSLQPIGAICTFTFAFNLDELAHKCLINVHHCSVIIKVTHVSGCTEYRDQPPICKEFIAIFHYLMRSRYQIDVQLVANILHCLFIEGHSNSS